MVGAVDEPLPFAGQNRRGVVIPLLERLDHAGLCRVEPLGVEGGCAEHVDEEGQTLVKVALQAVHRGSGERFVGAHSHLGREEVERFVELRRRQLPRAPLAEHSGRHRGEARHIGGIERGGPLERHREIHERKFVGRCEIDNRAVGQHAAKCFPVGWREFQRRKRDLLRPGGDARRGVGGGRCGFGGRGCCGGSQSRRAVVLRPATLWGEEKHADDADRQQDRDHTHVHGRGFLISADL